MDVVDTGVLITLTWFLIPGVIIDYLARQTTTIKQCDGTLRLIYLSGFSLLNYALFGWLVDFMPWFWLKLAVVIITSSLVGVGVCHVHGSLLIRKLLDKVGLHARHPMSTAWEFVFNRKEQSFICVHLKSGEIYRGVFGSSSIASDNYDHLDLYLEKICKCDDNGDWYYVENSKGVYIPYDEIQALEIVE